MQEFPDIFLINNAVQYLRIRSPSSWGGWSNSTSTDEWGIYIFSEPHKHVRRLIFLYFQRIYNILSESQHRWHCFYGTDVIKIHAFLNQD